MGETLRILMLEDVPSDAELAEIELRQAGIGFVALRVETEPEFRLALTDFQPDLILADYALPSFNALEALRIVNQQSPSVPFILVTGSQSEEIAARVMKEGAQDYLLKSSLMRLPSAVRNALERKAAHRAKLQAEEELREGEERFRAIAEQTSDVVFITDTRGMITYLSPAATKVFGFELDEMLDLPFSDLLSPESVDTAVAAFTDAIEGGIPCRNLELKMKRKDSAEFYGELTGSLFRVGNFTGITGTISDITERKQLEQAVEKARADFLFAVSHELKTPLHVMGAIQEMIESLPQEQQFAHFRDYSDVWRRNMMRLRFIIENLVDSQRPAGMGLKLEQQPANLMDLAREIAGELEPVASARSVQLRFQGESLPLSSIDRNAVRRLLENLLTNAIKFSPLGGQVEIRLQAEDEMVCLDIADFGMGIDPQIKPFLFQPFYRSPEALKA
ncbi:MAG: PAS domain S-box protein, partial [Coprothermobacterota bacterium]|nr:PAS domain S-box protein [Coprothermobacterota bacterium]